MMSLAYTPHTLVKLEQLLKSLEYKVRYDKGNFKTGACIVDQNKIIVVNKFASLESKIIALAEMIRNFNVDESLLSDNQIHFFKLLKQTRIQF
jgi:hypothetical protein